MGLFGGKKPKVPSRPVPVEWVRNPRGQFYKFITFEPDQAGLKGVGGVYVLWHSGVRPHWVYVGESTDIATDLDALGNNEEVMEFDGRGGLYVTWAPIKPEFRRGIVRYLVDNMEPMVDNPKTMAITDEPFPVLVPGAKAA